MVAAAALQGYQECSFGSSPEAAAGAGSRPGHCHVGGIVALCGRHRGAGRAGLYDFGVSVFLLVNRG